MKVSDEVIKVLDAVAEKFGLVVDHASDNLASYAELLLKRCVSCEIVTSIIWIIVSICVIAICAVPMYKMSKNKNMFVNKQGESDVRYLVFVVLIILCLLSSVGIVTELIDIVTCCTFPEKVFIDELRSVYKDFNS